MYFYTTKKKDKNGNSVEYLQLCRSYRGEDGKPKREVLRTLGRKDDPKVTEEVERFVSKLTGVKTTKELLAFVDDEVTLESSKLLGPNLLFRKLWNDLKLNEIFSGEYREHVLMMTVNRLCDPRSKMDCMRWKETVYEPLWNKIQLHELYRALDYLMNNKERIEYQMFNNIRDVFNQSTDLMLFDTTSVSYWGEGENAPELLKRGYSKEKRNDLKQLIVALLMTEGGIPVGHETYPGNQVDVTSFPKIIAKVKDKFNLKRVVWVCDRGMISESNIELLDSIKHEYIIGIKMRMLNAAQKEILLTTKYKDFQKIHDNLLVKQVIVDIEVEDNKEEKKIEPESKQSEQNNEKSSKKKEKKTKTISRRYVVCYNPQQAKIDAINREHFKEIIQKKVLEKTDKSWIVKNGYKKYVKLKEDIIEGIDLDKLEKEKIYDGKWVLLTNTKLEYTEIAKYYKSLWQIENAFSELKSSLDVKSMYHWTERRIRGHIFICFLALVLELGLKNKLVKVSYDEAMEDLKKLQVSLLKVRGVDKVKRTKLVGAATSVFEQLKLPLPSMNMV